LGGRSTTVAIKDDPTLGTIELGASIFVEANKNLMKATEKFGLKRTRLTALADEQSSSGRPGLGVWDGNEFLFEETGSYWDSMKAIWRYGLTPLKVCSLLGCVCVCVWGGGSYLFLLIDLIDNSSNVSKRLL
jgi:prenylcysteine oxidase/farnesylcysteine lyase